MGMERESTAVPIKGCTPFLQSCSLELPMLLQRLAISEVAMVDMAMEDMVAMGATGMERDLLKLKLMLSQDIPEDMEDMDMEVMVAMDVATTERGRRGGGRRGRCGVAEPSGQTSPERFIVKHGILAGHGDAAALLQRSGRPNHLHPGQPRKRPQPQLSAQPLAVHVPRSQSPLFLADVDSSDIWRRTSPSISGNCRRIRSQASALAATSAAGSVHAQQRRPWRACSCGLLQQLAQSAEDDLQW